MYSLLCVPWNSWPTRLHYLLLHWLLRRGLWLLLLLLLLLLLRLFSSSTIGITSIQIHNVGIRRIAGRSWIRPLRLMRLALLWCRQTSYILRLGYWDRLLQCGLPWWKVVVATKQTIVWVLLLCIRICLALFDLTLLLH